MRMRCMHGWRAGEEEERKREVRRRHMWTVPLRGSAILASLAADGGSASPSSPFSSSPNSTSFFSKDGRKISVGDCALFKPPQDSPPFIGIIRSVTAGKENKLTLSVNWLYRPAEVKLGKGFPLEAAPNEIFYSFHKDEIPAASLLHPCKVAFLPKGVELPSGIASFVCRKVYDIN
ncbi:BAH domain [Melia azedarach]|uniref:BAH domain n=1 Tax=Melia azedarach TaxID=155640 RepID=A0ACC1YB24_MELAZ|nr:BAH domain [Melia azedarach]